MHISWGILNPTPEIRAAIEKEIKKMKKILAMTMALAMSLSLVACGGNGATSSTGSASTGSASASQNSSASTGSASSSAASGELTTVEAGKLIMSTNAAFPPYEMTDDTGAVVGIDAEIAGAIAEKLGLELVIDDMDFDAAQLAVQQGKSDICMAGLSITEDRLLVMDFSDSYATGVQVVITKEGSDVTLDNLGEKMIGTQRATTGNIYCTDEYGEDHVVSYDDGIVAVQDLMNGKVDCVVIDQAPAQEFVAANPGLVILDTPWVEEEYSIGVNKGNTAMLDAVNGALAELTADGTLQAIIEKYIPTEG